MNKLEKLQKAYREKLARLKELKALETRTPEQETEFLTIMTNMETLGTDIDTEQRAVKLENDALFAEGDEEETRETIVIKDQPVYRGTQAAAFGQQMVDVAMVTDPNLRSSGNAKESLTRLEQNTKRALTLIEKSQGQPVSKDFIDRSMKPIFSPEHRAAGTGQIQGIGSEGGFLLQSE